MIYKIETDKGTLVVRAKNEKEIAALTELSIQHIEPIKANGPAMIISENKPMTEKESNDIAVVVAGVVGLITGEILHLVFGRINDRRNR